MGTAGDGVGELTFPKGRWDTVLGVGGGNAGGENRVDCARILQHN